MEEKPTALVVYAGSTKGSLTGGEYVHVKFREVLQESFDVKEILIDN